MTTRTPTYLATHRQGDTTAFVVLDQHAEPITEHTGPSDYSLLDNVRAQYLHEAVVISFQPADLDANTLAHVCGLKPGAPGDVPLANARAAGKVLARCLQRFQMPCQICGCVLANHALGPNAHPFTGATRK